MTRNHESPLFKPAYSPFSESLNGKTFLFFPIFILYFTQLHSVGRKISLYKWIFFITIIEIAVPVRDPKHWKASHSPSHSTFLPKSLFAVIVQHLFHFHSDFSALSSLTFHWCEMSSFFLIEFQQLCQVPLDFLPFQNIVVPI